MSHFTNFSILYRNRNFGLLYLGQFVSFIGTMITSVALPYQIYHLTHSTLMVGLLSLAQLCPLLITALLGGVFADRYHRLRLLLISESLLAVGCILLALNADAAVPQIWAIFLISMAMSALTGLHRPALDGMTQQLVHKNDFAAIGALRAFRNGVCMIAGPAIGGLLIAYFGIVLTFWVDCASFVLSLISLIMMQHIPAPPEANKHLSTWQSLQEGFRYAASRQELLGTYFVDFAAMIFGMPTALFPALAHQMGGAKTLGMLYAAPAVGSLVVSFVSGWVTKVQRQGVAIAIAASLWGVAIILFGLASNIYIALFFLALAGGFDAISGIFRSIIWNQTIPTNFRGRLSGIEMISYLSGPKLGDTESGLVAAAFGITASIISGGALCIAGVAVCCYCLPRFWHYRAEPHNS